MVVEASVVRNTGVATAKQEGMDMYQLEDRILFDGAAIVDVAAAAAAAAEQQHQAQSEQAPE